MTKAGVTKVGVTRVGITKVWGDYGGVEGFVDWSHSQLGAQLELISS